MRVEPTAIVESLPILIKNLPVKKSNHRSYLHIFRTKRVNDHEGVKLIAILALFILSLLWLSTKLAPSSSSSSSYRTIPSTPELTSFGSLSLFFRDLTKEGLLKTADKALILTGNGTDSILNAFEATQHLILVDEMDIISEFDIERQNSVANESFDFIFTVTFSEFIDRALKPGGIVAVELTRDSSSHAFERPDDYRVVYLRRFNPIAFIVLRKMEGVAMSTAANRQGKDEGNTSRLLKLSDEERKAALRNLEDVLLEPPRSASGKSTTYRKKTRFLPDLLNDSLEGYPRRVFIDVGEKGGGNGTKWFMENYPTRNQPFDIYRIETVPETKTEVEELDVWGPPQMEMSDWLMRNVKDEEYVVMKAEAEVVEEMTRSKEVIGLIDELFLECKPKGKGKGSITSSWNKIAYWECLALYGRLRDLSIAVHQWWG